MLHAVILFCSSQQDCIANPGTSISGCARKDVKNRYMASVNTAKSWGIIQLLGPDAAADVGGRIAAIVTMGRPVKGSIWDIVPYLICS